MKGATPMALQYEHWISPEEYLRIDRASLDVKYEYVDGRMYAMAGGTVEHAQIAMNMIRALADHLQGSECRVFSSDVRVQVASNKYYFPDATISCDPQDMQRGVDIIRSPRLVVEVLSKSTETKDRGEKFRHYKACPSIQEYVLISTQCQEVESFRRQGQIWIYQQFGSGQEVRLSTVDLTILMADVYRLTDIPEQALED
ncbi:MAG: Uma2 family endonuclease [Chloroflexi bacterium]|nr:MAG: Uma2 family endonuclease [Chloroflexota bacterium]